MKLRWNPLLLRKHRSYPCTRCVYFHDEGLVGVWMDKDRRAGEGFFELLECLRDRRVPGQRLGHALRKVGKGTVEAIYVDDRSWQNQGSVVIL